LGKFTGAAMTEALTIYSLIKKEDTLAVINGYIATFLISKIGTVMAATLTHYDISGEIGSRKLRFTRDTKFKDDFELIKRLKTAYHMNFIQWIGMLFTIIFNRLMRFTYIVIYFYFTPLLVIAIPQLFCGTNNDGNKTVIGMLLNNY